MAGICDKNAVKEDFKGMGRLTSAQIGWAEWLLSRKLAVTNGLWGHMSLEMKRAEKGFKRFEKRWEAWWDSAGKHRHAKRLEIARKVFHKRYALDKHGTYVPREQMDAQLTVDEIRRVKRQFRTA